MKYVRNLGQWNAPLISLNEVGFKSIYEIVYYNKFERYLKAYVKNDHISFNLKFKFLLIKLLLYSSKAI